MKKILPLVLALAVTLPSLPVRAKESNHFLTPSDMVKMMTKSKTTYKMDTLKSLKDMGPEQFAEAYWPTSTKQLEYPFIEDDGKGHLSLVSYPFDSAAMDIVKAAEDAYGEKKYDQARELYEKAIAASPKCYFAHIGLGDCLFFTGDLEKAVASYQKAIDLNPYDFRGFFFKAHALAKLNRFEEARGAFVKSLALQPHRESIIKIARTFAAQMGVVVDDSRFLPQALARLEGKDVAIYSDPDNLSSFYHAMCKGLWLGEPEHRKQVTGKEEHNLTTSEESECLASLVIGYLQARDDGKIPPAPALDRIKSILDDGLLNELIYYDIVVRFSPMAILLLPASERQALESYVAKYVLAPKQPADSGKVTPPTGP